MSHQLSIAVTGAGGGVGQSIIKSLYQSDYRIVAMDGEALGTALHAAPVAYKIPYANRPDFIDRLLEICQTEACKLLFPGFDIELPLLAQNVQRFASIGTKVVVSSPEVVEIADDKMLTYLKLTECGVTVPKTVDLAMTRELPSLPFILKPKKGGARSKDVYVINSLARLEVLKSNPEFDLTQFVAQDYIEGEEYTCGTVTLDDRHVGTIVMRRILRDGDTYKCFSMRHPVIEAAVEKIVAALKPIGALNVQLRMKDGIPYIFELNARCSGTTGARSLAGFNEPKLIADYFLRNIQPSFDIEEVSILRYWKELVVENGRIDALKASGMLVNERFQKL